MSNARIMNGMSVRTIINVLSGGDREVSDFLCMLKQRNVDPVNKVLPLLDLYNQGFRGQNILRLYRDVCFGNMQKFIEYLRQYAVDDL